MADELINGLIERQVKASAVYQRGVEDERKRIHDLLVMEGLKNVEELLNEPRRSPRSDRGSVREAS